MLFLPTIVKDISENSKLDPQNLRRSRKENYNHKMTESCWQKVYFE